MVCSPDGHATALRWRLPWQGLCRRRVAFAGAASWNYLSIVHGRRKEPRFATYFNQNSATGNMWDVALGARAGIWRYGNDDPNWPEGWQVDMEGAVFPRLDPNGPSTPLYSDDFRFGIPVTYGGDRWEFKVAYYHISAHLGDEYILTVNPAANRINFVRDGIASAPDIFSRPPSACMQNWVMPPSTAEPSRWNSNSASIGPKRTTPACAEGRFWPSTPTCARSGLRRRCGHPIRLDVAQIRARRQCAAWRSILLRQKRSVRILPPNRVAHGLGPVV